MTPRRGGEEAAMKALMVVVVIVAIGVMASIARGAMAEPVTVPAPSVTSATIAQPDGFAVDDRYLVPHLPDATAGQLPAAERTGDRYLAERVALADLVIGERILAAEDLATDYARKLPGFTAVLLADGFRQDTDGTWFYDVYSSWMRFPLNR
jgi:hypothetical protein